MTPKAKGSLSSYHTIRTFLKVGTWSETVMTVVDGAFDHTLAREEQAAMPLAGGVAGMGFQCGQLWGGALAAGAQAYRLYGPGSQAEAAAVIAAQRLVNVFRNRYKSIDCLEVTRFDWKNPKTVQLLGFFLRGGPIRCFSMTAGYSRSVFREINTAFPEDHPTPAFTESSPSTAAPVPVSCAALLARKMGASEMHAVMAAGFAGGIGLSGGACGALGAAIWLTALNKRNGPVVDLNSPETMAVIDRFVESTEIKFECAEITGRKFQNVSEHAAYLREGGCAQVIQALAKN